MPTATSKRVRMDRRTRLASSIGELLNDIAADQDERWGGGILSPSAYEAAWVALVRDPTHPERLAFPAPLIWLLRHQRPDGSWSPDFPFSLVPTMAALLALAKAPEQSESVRAASERAHRYLRRALRRWSAEATDTPFFEFLVPLLADELARQGIRLSVPDLELMQQRRTEKLERVPVELLYAGTSNLLHALEVFGPGLDYARLRKLQAPSGCYGCSPSATAAVLLRAPVWDEAAARWLRWVSARGSSEDGGAMPTSYPADTFEAAWVLHLLMHGGFPLDPASTPSLRHILLWLRACLTPEGASFARNGALPNDADDTGLVLTVLNRAGVQSPLDSLWLFERNDHFVSYAGERTSSTSANAHVLEALLSVDAIGLPELAVRRDKAVYYLLGQRSADGFWMDKWHLSPYYATLSCVLALARMPDPHIHAELGRTVSWLRETQRRGGGWGLFGATLEETGCAVLALLALRRVTPSARTEDDIRMLRQGQRYLQRHIGALDSVAELPALWVDKTLYAPPRVIRAVVLAALYGCALASL